MAGLIRVGLFVNKKYVDTRVFQVAPREGETIIIDCGEMVRVIEVSHDWDDPVFVQVNTMPFSAREEWESEI